MALELVYTFPAIPLCPDSELLPPQVCSIEFDRKDIPMNKVVATTLEAKLSVYDLRTQHPTKGFASLTEKVARCYEGISCLCC